MVGGAFSGRELFDSVTVFARRLLFTIESDFWTKISVHYDSCRFLGVWFWKAMRLQDQRFVDLRPLWNAEDF